LARTSKIARFAEMRDFPNVYQPAGKQLFHGDDEIKGKWNRVFFRNDHPLVLELGCGKGEYTVELARRNPHTNFIGMDIKGSRMWKGARRSLDEGLKNAAFLRARIEFIERLFAPGEVSELWITFPDPQPKKAKNRLVSSWFLNAYRNCLQPGGEIHLKTDSLMLHHYLLDLLKENRVPAEQATDDLYAAADLKEELAIKTFYEARFLNEGKKITYLSFKMPAEKLWVEPLYFQRGNDE